jgi:hypothetical protein
MSYSEIYNTLKKSVNYDDDIIKFDKSDIYNYSFTSKAYKVLPGKDSYFCENHDSGLSDKDSFKNDIGSMEDSLNIPDSEVESNKSFRYHIFHPSGSSKANEIIMFFHGFNEKYWDKYLPWAKKIADDTNKTVVLFPIAFHMNRAPISWGDKRKMFSLSEMRKSKFPDIVSSALSNVAISMRLHAMPQRFIWSGLQTYYDIIQFVKDIKLGNHPLIEKDCSINFFAYSIGCLLAEIIKLTDYDGYFTKSKLCMFCGGAVFNRLSPVSKFILDSEANVALYSYLVEHISSHIKNNERLGHYLNKRHPEGDNFHCMLDIRVMRDYRENLFKKIESGLTAFALKKDTVIPSYEIQNTLQGISRDINIPVEVFDFPYNYIHEDPFPANKPFENLVDESFNMIFGKICNFLK